MKRLLNILVFFVLASAAMAQEETRIVDSLLQEMARQEGYEKAETMQELSRAFVEISYDECVSIGEKAIEESAKTGDIPLLSQAYWKLGLSYLEHYDFDLAHQCFEQASELLSNSKQTELTMLVLDYKGRVELLMGEFDLALSTYQKALEVSENLGDQLNSADVINNMAYIFFNQDELDKSLDYFENARRRYMQLGDTLSIAQCDNNISNIYIQWQQYDQAKKVLQRAIPVFLEYNDEGSLAHAYHNFGLIYATGHVNLDSAMVYLQKSVICAENVGDETVLIEDEIETANILMLLGHEREALDLYQTALHSSESMGYMKGLLEAYRYMGIYYNEKGDFTTSAVYLKRCMDLAQEKGNQLLANTVRPYLIADYAHLGHFAEMKKELGLFEDDYTAIFSESNELSEELSRLRYYYDGLLQQYDTQNAQIETLQTQRNHYRLAFFGLLALVLFAVVLFLAYKIVRKKRAKSVNP